MTDDEVRNLIAKHGSSAFNLSEKCARCGGTFGKEHTADGHCFDPVTWYMPGTIFSPVVASVFTMTLTEDEVRDLIAIKGHAAFSNSTICARCSGTWGHDHLLPEGRCVDPWSGCGVLLTTFYPMVSPSQSASNIDTPNKQEEVPEWKKWRNDQPGNCPCGIAKQDCWIHKS
jgi:hypothetical protein